MVAIVTDVRFRMSLALIRDLAQMGVEVITCEGERCRDNPAAPALEPVHLAESARALNLATP